jgi:hypothetical protein
VDTLVAEGYSVSVLDNLSSESSSEENVNPFRKNEGQRTLADAETTYKYFNFRANRSLFDYINFIKQLYKLH